jgi:hypothetical protein
LGLYLGILLDGIVLIAGRAVRIPKTWKDLFSNIFDGTSTQSNASVIRQMSFLEKFIFASFVSGFLAPFAYITFRKKQQDDLEKAT